MKCQQCKIEIAIPNVRFCPFCGADFSRPRPEERRNAIIVFADLSGFTALSQQHDPDTFRSLIDRIMKRFSAIVTEQGGVVDKIIGDAIMFVFGTERTSEDDPIRAIETMEQLRSELALFRESEGLELRLHIGASFGVVSVGTVGSSRTVMGDTVNLASRLLSVAKTGETILSESFAELLGYGHQLEELEPVSLKGFSKSVTPFRYQGKATFHEEEPTFVGREKELAESRERIAPELKQGRGGSLLVHAPAGMGKSRFLVLLRNHLAPGATNLFTLHFEERGTAWHLPFQKLAEAMIHTLQVGEGSSRMRLWHFAQGDIDFWRNITFEQLQNLFFELWNEVGRHGSMLLFCEDLHRADTSGLRLLEKIIKEQSGPPLYVVATSRKKHGFFGESIELKGLSQKESMTLFSSLVDAKEEGLVDAVDRCEGNPLFVRELARGVRANLSPEKTFSGKIDLLIASSIDALQPGDQELVKKAAMFGSRVPLEQLAFLAGNKTESCLKQLQPLGMFYFLAKEEVLVFQHDLVRDSAYERINLGVRKEWHQSIAEILESQKASPEESAYHWLRSDEEGKAIEAALHAGRHLGWLGRVDEAVTFLKKGEELARKTNKPHLLLNAVEQQFSIESKKVSVEEGLELLGRLEEDKLLRDEEDFLGSVALLRARFLHDRYKQFEALAEVEKAGRLLQGCRQADVNLLQVRILGDLGERKDMVRLSMEALRTKSLRDDQRGYFWNILGSMAFADRHVVEAKDFFEKATEAFRKSKEGSGERMARKNLGQVYRAQKEHTKALKQLEIVAQLALKSGDLVEYGGSLRAMAQIKEADLNYDEALALLQNAFEMMSGRYDQRTMIETKLALGFLLVELGEVKEAERLGNEAKKLCVENEALRNESRSLVLLALVCHEQNDLSRGLRFLEQALEKGKTFSAVTQAICLMKIEFLLESDHRSQARQELDQFYDSYLEHTLTDFSQVTTLRLESILSSREDSKCLAEIKAYFAKTKDDTPDFRRLTLLVEALEYGHNEGLLREGRDVVSKLRKAFPKRYQVNFDQKKVVCRFYKLAGMSYSKTHSVLP